jgi:hypothetical protein
MDTIVLPRIFQTTVVGLGVPVSYFPIRGRNRVGNLIAGILFLLAAIGVLFYGLSLAASAFGRSGLNGSISSLLTPVAIAFASFLISLAFFWSVYRNWNRGVAVYDGGLAYRDRRGMKLWHWEEITSVTEEVTRHYTSFRIYVRTTHIYRLLNSRNEQLVFNDAFAGVVDLINAIEAKVFPILYDRKVRQFNLGEPVSFGPITVNTGGIKFKSKSIPWTEIKQITLRKGIIRVVDTNGTVIKDAVSLVRRIPNFEVLMKMINQVAGVKAG